MTDIDLNQGNEQAWNIAGVDGLSCEFSEWTCEICKGLIFHPVKGEEPNWFWRKMQYYTLGFRWSRVDKKEG